MSAPDKFQILTIVPLPADCIACGRKSDGSNEFVDLTKDIDYYGAILLCRNCAEEIGSVVGLTDSDELDTTQSLLNTYAATNVELQDKVEALESVVFAYGLTAGLTLDEPTINNDSSEVEDEGEQVSSGPKPRSVKSVTSK